MHPASIASLRVELAIDGGDEYDGKPGTGCCEPAPQFDAEHSVQMNIDHETN